MSNKSSGNLRTSKKLFAYSITVIVLVAVFALLYFWRGHNVGNNQGWPQQAVPVDAIKVRPQSLAKTVTSVATLTAVNQVVLAPEVAGRVTGIHFESGERVEEGQLLVQLFDATERANVSASEAAIQLAGAQLTRAQQLAPLGAESKELLAQRVAENEQAIAAGEQSRAQLRLKKVMAPFSGTLGLRRVDLGEYLSPGTTIATLTDLSRLFVEFSLPQQQLAAIQTGDPVHITVDAYPTRTFEAKVTAIEPQLEAETRNILVQATLANPENLLRPAMYASAEVEVGMDEGVLLLPRTAVMSSAQGNSVVVVRGETPEQAGNVEHVGVTVGRRVGNQVVITQGLSAGDVVVVNGQNRIQPQAMLEVKSMANSQGSR